MPYQENESAEMVWKYVEERKGAGDQDAVNLTPPAPSANDESVSLRPLVDALQEMFEADHRATNSSAARGQAQARARLIEAIQEERARNGAEGRKEQKKNTRHRPWFLMRPAFASLGAGMVVAGGLCFAFLSLRPLHAPVQTSSAPDSKEKRIFEKTNSRRAPIPIKSSGQDLRKRTARTGTLEDEDATVYGRTPGPSIPASANKGHGSAATATLPKAQNHPPRSGFASGLPSDRVQDDLAYINADAADSPRRWVQMPADEAAALEARLRRDVRVKDDFVAVAFPRIASGDNQVVAAAVAAYRREAAVVDARLARDVNLQLKGASLEELCAALETQIGVRLRAARGVRDEKATVLVKDEPARDVMRAVSRLFGFQWERSGEEGDYRYLLNQDLRAQLAEEELRNRDLDEALLALDNEMKSLGGISLDEMKARVEQAAGPDRQRLQMLTIGGGWGAAQLYQSLSPAERTALRSGQELRFFAHSEQPNRRLPEEARQSLLQSWGLGGIIERNGKPQIDYGGPGLGGSPGSTPIAKYPGIVPSVRLKIDRSELGVFSLEADVSMWLTKGDGSLGASTGHTNKLALGRSPSAEKPDNAKRNNGLRDLPSFQREVSFRPEPSCPKQVKERTNAEGKHVGDGKSKRHLKNGDVLESAHVNSGDVWEEIHRQTGLPIVADYYTRLYPVPPVTVEHAPLFDALCRVGDALGVWWRQDGGFLLCRSTSFFWDKLKEVPSRYLTQWQQERTRRGSLPFEAVLQMASLSDQQLDSATVGRGISHCWDLPEWGIVGNAAKPLEGTGTATSGTPEELRAYTRFVAGLPAGTRNLTLRPDGLPFDALDRAQQQEFARIYLVKGDTNPQILPGLRIHVDYIPAGTYVWHPVVEEEAEQRYIVYTQISKLPAAAGKTVEGALAEARRIYPKAAANQIKRSRGIVAFTFIHPDDNRARASESRSRICRANSEA